MSDKYRITAPVPLVEDLVKDLKTDPQSSVQVQAAPKNLSGLDVLTIIADLATVGSSLLAAWQVRNQVMSTSIKIEKVLSDGVEAKHQPERNADKAD